MKAERTIFLIVIFLSIVAVWILPGYILMGEFPTVERIKKENIFVQIFFGSYWLAISLAFILSVVRNTREESC